MQIMELYRILENNGAQEEASRLIHALRSDGMIFGFFDNTSSEESERISKLCMEKRFHPGTLGLLALDPYLVECSYPKCRLQTGSLEEYIVFYESFLQQHLPPASLENAARLAVVLLEKRKISSDWRSIWLEIKNRMQIADGKTLAEIWGTVLLIVLNIAEDKKALLSDLCATELMVYSRPIIIHGVLGLPVDESRLASMLVETAGETSAGFFESILFDLIAANERSLAVAAAQRYAETHISNPPEMSKNDLALDQMGEIVEKSLQNKHYASIAQIAKNYSLATTFFNASAKLLDEVLDAYEIQKQSLLRKTGEDQGGFSSETDLDAENQLHPLVGSHYATANLPAREIADQDVKKILDGIQEAKGIHKSGHMELARAELAKLFDENVDEKINIIAGFRSGFDPEWNPVDIIYDLLEMGEPALAERMADEILKNNPASENSNLAAAKAYINSGAHSKALPILEVLSLSEDKDVNQLRLLADCYDKTGNASESLKVRRVILDHFETIDDLLSFSETALHCGMPEDAQNAARKVLETDPRNAVALTRIASSMALMGQHANAAEYFDQAVDAGMHNPELWITYADFLFGKNDYHSAIETLRKGLLVLPEDHFLRRKLAELLMETGSAAEALPYLNELTGEVNDIQLEILRIEAMRTLGLPEYKDLIEELHEKYPENLEVTREHAAELIKEGRHGEAKKIIQERFNEVDPEDETALTYVEALIGMDVKNAGEAKSVTASESIKAQNILSASLEKNPEHSRANLLLAEFYLQKSRHAEAFEIYSSLMEKQAGIDKTLLERIQAGFATAAANLGKFEIALAAIKQAVDSKPEWVGLRKIFAQIYALAGEINEAVKEAEIVFRSGAQLIDGIFWFSNFLSGIGREREAREVIEKAIAETPDDLFLRCKLAEMLIEKNKLEEAESIMEPVKVEINDKVDPREIKTCAKIFCSLADKGVTLECLSKLVGINGSLESKLEYAGYLCVAERHQDALEVLHEIKDGQEDLEWVQLFVTDVLYRNGDLELINNSVQETHQLPENLVLDSSFLPSSWQKVLTDPFAVNGIQAKVAYALGDPNRSLDLAKKWLEQDVNDFEARLLIHESLLALGQKSDEDPFSGLMQFTGFDAVHAQLVSLWINDLMEKEQAIEAQQLVEKFGDLPYLGIKAAGIRISLISGHLNEAETHFDEVIAEFKDFKPFELHIHTGLARLVISAGVSLKRWAEVLQFSQQLATAYPWNIELIDQALAVLVQAKEFEGLSVSLQISAHSPANYFKDHDFGELFECLSALAIGHNESAVKRWLLRGKMAIQPADEHVRSFALVTSTPADSAAMVTALYANGQKDTALQVAKKHSDHPSMLLALARIHAREDEIHLALECMNSLIAADPLDPVAFAFRSLLYESNENLDYAINDLEQAISDWPLEVRWRSKAAGLWQKYGNNKNALIQLESAAQIDPEDLEVTLELAKSYMAEKQPDQTIEYAKIITGTYPNQYEAWEVLSEAYAMKGDTASALAAAQQAGKFNANSLKPYLMAGKIYLDSGEIDKAYTQAKAAINQNKKDADVVLFLARVLHAKGEERQALATLETMHRCENVTAQTMIDHVNLVREINGSASAKELIASLSGKYPENIELMKLLANAQVENGDTIEAEETAKKALQVDPDEPDIHMFLGKLNAESGQLDQAISHLSQGITHRTANLDGYLLLSRVYEQQREFAKAIDTLKQAMEVSPADTRSYIAAANLYRNSKNYSAAEEVLQKAVEIDPQDISLRRQLGALLALKLVHHSQEASMNS